jgi:hypothetical protein
MHATLTRKDSKSQPNEANPIGNLPFQEIEKPHSKTNLPILKATIPSRSDPSSLVSADEQNLPQSKEARTKKPNQFHRPSFAHLLTEYQVFGDIRCGQLRCEDMQSKRLSREFPAIETEEANCRWEHRLFPCEPVSHEMVSPIPRREKQFNVAGGFEL